MVRLTATSLPGASDLRFVVIATSINTELERIGDQAWNMRQYARLLLSEPELKRLIDLRRMANTATKMMASSLRAFEDGSAEDGLAVIRSDDEVDALNDQIFREALTCMITDAKNITRSVALVLTARAIERIVDHATNMGEEVVYLVKGEDIRHSEAIEIED